MDRLPGLVVALGADPACRQLDPVAYGGPVNVDPTSAESPYQLVIFDCDGVLVDTEPIAAVVSAAALGELGWHLSPDEVSERFTGKTNAYFQSEVEAFVGGPLPEGWREAVDDEFARRCEAELLPIKGVIDVIEQLTNPAWVASNGTRQVIERSLRIVELDQYFAGRIVSAEDVEHGKPAPDVYLRAAQLAGVDPIRCVVVEDSPTGITAARAAGMHIFAFASGFYPIEALEGPATTIFTDMSELPALLTL
jgi:HAD superfamily hydrolase (TIGR01509 family)